MAQLSPYLGLEFFFLSGLSKPEILAVGQKDHGLTVVEIGKLRETIRKTSDYFYQMELLPLTFARIFPDSTEIASSLVAETESIRDIITENLTLDAKELVTLCANLVGIV